MAYQTDDISGQLRTAQDGGCRLINETPVAGTGGKWIAFLHPKSTMGVLTEFCTKKSS
jgi:methylmalonyl-CoA/ethylmalonyl-CoA epimerase